MPSFAVYEDLRQIVQAEFADVVTCIDGSYADIFVSASGRYSYHWERTVQGEKLVFRHDNAPHTAWRQVATFPKHFHDGSESNVIASYISSEPEQAIREFCRFIRTRLRDETAP